MYAKQWMEIAVLNPMIVEQDFVIPYAKDGLGQFASTHANVILLLALALVTDYRRTHVLKMKCVPVICALKTNALWLKNGPCRVGSDCKTGYCSGIASPTCQYKPIGASCLQGECEHVCDGTCKGYPGMECSSTSDCYFSNVPPRVSKNGWKNCADDRGY